jgi:hypothetical protein
MSDEIAVERPELTMRRTRVAIRTRLSALTTALEQLDTNHDFSVNSYADLANCSKNPCCSAACRKAA